MSMVVATRRVLENYFNFRDRAPRAEFWWFFLAQFLVVFAISFVEGALWSAVGTMHGMHGMPMMHATPVASLVSLALLIPSLAVSVRRLHDTGRTGWWVLVNFIPLVGVLVLIWFFVQPGDDGENAYGPPRPLPA